MAIRPPSLQPSVPRLLLAEEYSDRRPEDVRRVAALSSAAFSRPSPREFEGRVEKPAFCCVREMVRAELSQHSVAEADVSQFQA